MPEQKNREHARSNRFFLKIAGRRLRAYSILTHVGRRSGREYRNPVGAYPLGDGFVIAVLYGRQSQWVRNVMASDSFTLRTDSFTLRTKGARLPTRTARNHPLLAGTRRLPALVAMDPRATKDRSVRVGALRPDPRHRNHPRPHHH